MQYQRPHEQGVRLHALFVSVAMESRGEFLGLVIVELDALSFEVGLCNARGISRLGNTHFHVCSFRSLLRSLERRG